jgi:hypothetical protein
MRLMSFQLLYPVKNQAVFHAWNFLEKEQTGSRLSRDTMQPEIEIVTNID